MDSCINKQKRTFKRGVSTMYVILALLVIGFIGTSLINMAHHDVISGVDFYSSARARVAAKAGLQKFDHLVRKDPVLVKDIVADFVIKDSSHRWIYGSDTSTEVLKDNQRFKIEAVNLDEENFVMTVVSTGYAGGAQSSVTAFMELGNLELSHVIGSEQDFALYIGKVPSFDMYGPVDIDGNTYLNGQVEFDQLASGSRFRQTFRVSQETNHQYWQGTYTFDDLAYFGTETRLTGNVHMIMNNISAFEVRPVSGGAGNIMTFNNQTYMNKNGTGMGLDIYMNFHNLHHPSAWSWGQETWHDIGTEFYSQENPMNLLDSVGLKPTVCIPEVDVSAIPAGSRLSWEWLRDPDRYGYTGPLSHNPSMYYYDIDGTMANEIWQYAASSGRAWNGYAVVVVDTPMQTLKGGVFDKKIIFIVEDGQVLQPMANGQFFVSDSVDSNSSIMLYAAPGGSIQNIGDWDYFRGYIYVDSGASIAMGGAMNEIEPLLGAIHIQDNATSVAWYPKVSTVPTITYDYGVISDLMADGFLSFPCSAGNTVTNDSIIFSEGFGIDYQMVGVYY